MEFQYFDGAKQEDALDAGKAGYESADVELPPRSAEDAHGPGAGGSGGCGPMIDTKYVQELNAEKQTLDHETFPHAIRLVSHGQWLESSLLVTCFCTWAVMVMLSMRCVGWALTIGCGYIC